eukprot:gene1927-1166_t
MCEDLVDKRLCWHKHRENRQTHIFFFSFSSLCILFHHHPSLAFESFLKARGCNFVRTKKFSLAHLTSAQRWIFDFYSRV